MNTNEVKIGVIGIGAMGQNHMRVLSTMPGVRITAICEAHEERRNTAKERYRVPQAFADYRDFVAQADVEAIIIAVQPEFHREVALCAFTRRLPVLLEKPLAHSREDACAIVRAAQESGVACLCGHVERFNPVVHKAKSFIDEGRIGTPYLVNTQRSGPFPKRLLGTQIGVLTDLAVHDVDVIQYLSGSTIETVDALFISTPAREIYAKTLFRCQPRSQGDRLAGSMEFSWVSPRKIRFFQLFGTLGLIEGDYVSQSLKFYENPDEAVLSDPWAINHLGQGRIASGRIIEFPVWHVEPLRVELDHFIEVARGHCAPLIGPQAALQVLEVVLRIIAAGAKSPTTIICPN